jgi:polyphosphate glucokinase
VDILGIDIGGSALKAAPVDTRTGRLLAERHKVETPERLTPPQMAKVVGEIARHFRWKRRIGIGFPGTIHGTRVRFVGNLLPAFVGCDIGKLFSRASGCPVSVINDASAATLAEMRFGAGRGFEGKTLMLTLGTGLGSSLAYRGVVFPCELGFFPFKGKPAERVVAASVKKAKGLSWEHWARRLNKYLRVLEDALWPERIIIGGGISAKHDKFFKYLKTRAPLVPAGFLNEAGIVGAALWGGEER